MKFSSIEFRLLQYCYYVSFPLEDTFVTLTSPHLPTTSLMSFLPNDRSTIHLLTARLLLSGVRSSSAILTQPSDWTANRTGFSWGSVFCGSDCASNFADL